MGGEIQLMLTNATPYLRPGIVGVAYFNLKNHPFPSRWTIKLPHLYACTDSQGKMGVKWMHSQPKQRQHGLRNRKMSSQIAQTSESNLMTEESLQDLQLSPAYETAMEALSSLITQRKRGARPAVDSKYEKLDRMLMYVKILGLEEHLPGLKIIHVAGTKGKGSTCALCEAILRECGFTTGLFTSPHLIDVRERFRLDGVDISEDKFLHYFWDCWNQLKENVTEDLPMPPLFQFLTVLAFKIFVCEKVDVAIIEVGIGGRNDSTNVIKEPVVCGITSLGMDHMEVLGDTLGQIASHKAGILKCRVPAFSVAQLHEAMDVLQGRADELMVPLEVVAPLDCKKYGIKLSLSGDHQFINAGLAVSLCKSWLKSTGNWESLVHQNNWGSDLPEAFLRGLSTARLSGRAQVLPYSYLRSSTSYKVNESCSGDLTFYLDGAHSPESVEACARWFSTVVKENIEDSFSAPALKVVVEESRGNGYIQNEKMESNRISKRILLFNCMDVRDPEVLLLQLVETCASSGTHFSKAIFVPNMSTYSKITSAASAIPEVMPYKDLTWQFNLQRIWEKIIHGTDVLDINLERGMSAVNSPTLKFLYEDVSHCSPADGCFSCSAVFSSLPMAINWLKECVEENPSLRIQVLVTGSLHLVGDVLKLLRRRR